MYCPQCGMEVNGDGGFCPYCGRSLASAPPAESRDRRGSTGPDRRKVLAVAAIAVIIAAGALAVYAIADSERGPSDVIITIGPGESIPTGDGNYIALSGDFATGILSAYIDDSRQMVISLDSGTESAYEKFLWVMRDDSNLTYSSKTKTEGELIWSTPSAGEHTVLVYCYKGSGDTEYDVSYEGRIVYVGDRTEEYRWWHDGREYSMSLTIPVGEYESCRDGISDDVRHGYIPSAITDMTTTDGIVSVLEDSLSSLYDGDRGEYGYADFLLSFVQSCIGTSYDSVVHGHDDYWALPAETLYLGYGDSEDKSILYTSLCEAAGFRAGYVILPGHITSAVAFRGVSLSNDVQGFHPETIAHSGQVYLVAETTCKVALGYMEDKYDYDPSTNSVLYYGQRLTGDYGLYT